MQDSDLPDENDAKAIFAFAMTFNGYLEFGSFEACAIAAESRRRSTLADIRNELFLSARGSRHRGDDLFVETYKELLPLLRKYSAT